MAIQNRRGAYSDFDPQKMVPGEWAIVTSGDPNSERGKAVYIAFDVGDVERMATYEDMLENIDSATSDIQEQFTEDVSTAIADANDAVTSIRNNVTNFLNRGERTLRELANDSGEATYATRVAITNANSAANAAITAAAQAQAIIDAGGAVTTWNGRAGAVAPQAGDYHAGQITYQSSNVGTALLNLSSNYATLNNKIGDTAIQNKFGSSIISVALNSVVNELFHAVIIQDIEVQITYAAGTIGTRGAVVSVCDASTTGESGANYIVAAAYVYKHQNSSSFSATIGRNYSTNKIYVAAHRASTGAADAPVTVRVVWLKQTTDNYFNQLVTLQNGETIEEYM